MPFTIPFAPLMFVALGGCLEADGARIDPNDGEGEDWEGLAPLTPVCTAGGGGRFIFWWGGAGLVAMAVAISATVRLGSQVDDVEECDCETGVVSSKS